MQSNYALTTLYQANSIQKELASFGFFIANDEINYISLKAFQETSKVVCLIALQTDKKNHDCAVFADVVINCEMADINAVIHAIEMLMQETEMTNLLDVKNLLVENNPLDFSQIIIDYEVPNRCQIGIDELINQADLGSQTRKVVGMVIGCDQKFSLEDYQLISGQIESCQWADKTYRPLVIDFINEKNKFILSLFTTDI